LAATMTEDEMRDWIGVNSLKFISLDGLYRAAGEAAGRDAKAPKFCDACFSGDYPVAPSDKIEEGFQMKAAE
jgi:amidophosphoribosyltransferase